MGITEAQAKKLLADRRPLIGWVKKGNGWYYAPDDFAQSTAYTTDEFANFSRRSRARWNFFEYIRSYFVRP